LAKSESRIVLASASPRREALLRCLGIEFTIEAADVDEEAIGGRSAEEVTARVAAAKAEAAHRPGQVTIGADTAVVADEEILGKPRSPEEAVAMLRRLRGRTHRVLTAVAVLADGRRHVDVVATEVTMRNYSDEEIAAYVASGDPMDKAGAYAVQHAGFHPVRRIRGCYLDVVGLPLCHLARRLAQEGVRVPTLPPATCCRNLAQRCPVALAPELEPDRHAADAQGDQDDGGMHG
jgi:MAF protein